MSYTGDRSSIRLLLGYASCLLATSVQAQPVSADPSLIRALHPISEAADRLRKSYGMVITYEDPLWEWPGELVPALGSSKVAPDTKGGWTPDWVSFTLPGAASSTQDLSARLAQVLAAYHQQTGGPRFQILTSKLGLHIIPVQARDRDGRLAPAQNPLDKAVVIPQQERTAYQHLTAMGAALEAANDGLKLSIGPLVTDLRGNSFNFMFAPTLSDNRPFVWGTAASGVTARNALIDLLDRSATTFYWDMKCRGTLTDRYNVCHMYVAPLELATGTDGKAVNPGGGHFEKLTDGRQLRTYDRCGGCEGGRPPVGTVRQRQPK